MLTQQRAPRDSNSEGGSTWDSRNSTLGPAVKILLAKSGTTYPEPTAEDRKPRLITGQ